MDAQRPSKHLLLASASALLLAACAASPPRSDPAVALPGFVPARITGVAQRPVVALVLGSGAARGFAHVGVIKSFERHGLRPDFIVGTSAGSFVGALFAGGYSAAQLEQLALSLDEAQLWDLTFPDRGFIRGEQLQDYINAKLANRNIEELRIPFAAVATDLLSGREAVFNRGNTGMAVRASSAVPGVFQPVTIGGREYVDGALVSPIPIQAARDLGADVVVAVDIASKPNKKALPASTIELLSQAIDIMGERIAQRQITEADIAIRPDVQGLENGAFAERALAIRRGEQAADKALPRLVEFLRIMQHASVEKGDGGIKK